MSAELLVVVPSRSRPEGLARTLAALRRTCVCTDVVVALDADDYEQYARPDCEVVIQPDMTTSAKLNSVIMPRLDRYQAVMLVGDDNIPVITAWDRLMLNNLAYAPGFAWPTVQGREGHPELMMCSAEVVRALGWYFMPSLCHYYADDVLGALAALTGHGHYVPEAYFEHHHWRLGTGDRDDVIRRAELWAPGDQAEFERWKRNGLLADGALVRKVTGF